jgi:hypothetical protein
MDRCWLGVNAICLVVKGVFGLKGRLKSNINRVSEWCRESADTLGVSAAMWWWWLSSAHVIATNVAWGWSCSANCALPEHPTAGVTGARRAV